MPHFARVLSGTIGDVGDREIASSGYVLHTLEASLWCLLTTTSYNDTVLTAINLGDDTDTTGCVAGGLAGLHYGLKAIPVTWRGAMAREAEITALLKRFVRACAVNRATSASTH